MSLNGSLAGLVAPQLPVQTLTLSALQSSVLLQVSLVVAVEFIDISLKLMTL